MRSINYFSAKPLLMEQTKDNDTEFEQRHLEVLNFVKEDDQDIVDEEEAVFD